MDPFQRLTIEQCTQRIVQIEGWLKSQSTQLIHCQKKIEALMQRIETFERDLLQQPQPEPEKPK